MMKNRFMSSLIAVLIGIFFYLGYSFSKHLLWSWNLNNLLTWINPKTNFQYFIFFVSLNIIVAITSSLPAAVLCGVILVKLFKDKALLYGWVSILIVLLLQSRLWNIKKAPDLSVKISAISTPLLVGLTFFLSIFLIKKNWHPSTAGQQKES